MTSNQLSTISSIEDSDIDRDRIVDGDLVPDEFFCPICQYLLWKPRSCSSCQHLFCEKCIQTWLKNPNSEKKCPFRCPVFEDRRCPPYVQSLLSRLNIHCRNSEFGCTQILPYDQLEHHENIECKYLSQKCSECEKFVLQSKFDEHRQIAGLCIPCPIKCTICQNFIEKSFFLEHFSKCCQKRIDELNAIVSVNQNIERILNGQPIDLNNGLTFFEKIGNTMQLIEQQKRMSRLPTTLNGVDAIQRAREENCGHIYHILIMLKFILINWSKIPYFLYTLSTGGFIAIGLFILGGYLILSHWVYTHIYYGSIFLILLTYFLSYGTSFICQSVSDSMIIFCFVILIFLYACSLRGPLEVFETDGLFNRPILSIVLCCISIFIMKLILLLIRLYYSSMSINQAVGILTLINFYIILKAYRVYTNTITTRPNQLRMPV